MHRRGTHPGGALKIPACCDALIPFIKQPLRWITPDYLAVLLTFGKRPGRSILLLGRKGLVWSTYNITVHARHIDSCTLV